ncbi:MAG: CapA family protein [Bacteroidales bacterium]
MKIQLITVFIFFIPFWASCQQSTDQNKIANPVINADSAENEISFLFIGDIMTHQLQFESAYNKTTGKYDFSSQFEYIKPIINDVDVTVANFEVTLAGPPYSGYPAFSCPDQLATDIKNAGINYLVTANNHINDRGLDGFVRTEKVLDSVGLVHTGSFSSIDKMKNRHPMILNKKGWKIALFNYTYGVNGDTFSNKMFINIIDSSLIVSDLTLAQKQGFDAIIVFFHWGTEYQRHSNSEQQKLAGLCFENGANAVIGSHPHVIQEMENYVYTSRDGNKKDVIVAYSLGNFVSNYGNWRYADGGAMIRFSLTKEEKQINITKQGYYLVWVYRKPKTEKLKTFYVLPADQFENDKSLAPGDLKQMKVFINDSRTLLNQNNINIKEYRFNKAKGQWNTNEK